MRRAAVCVALCSVLVGVGGLWAVGESGEVALTATLYSDVIRFEADGVASLRLTIYDLAENELWTSGLILGDFVDWDRTNARGERLANGYYLYLAQGWNASEDLILDKAGKVVLLPGDQVQLKAAPTVGETSAAPSSSDEPVYRPMAYDATNWYVSNRIGVGTDSPSFPLHVYGASAELCVETQGVTASYRRYVDSASGPSVVYVKGRGSLGSPSAVQSGDVLGGFLFYAHDGSGLKPGAQIRGLVDGTPGLNDMPGMISFETSADGTASPVERMRITQAGNVGIGTLSPSKRLDVAGDINWSGSLYRGGNLLCHFSGIDATFFGLDAGTTASTGAGNTAFGNKALRDNTNGLSNTAFGRSALRENQSGDANTAVGDGALVNNDGSSNTAVGSNALVVNTSGDSNTAVGDDALYYNDTGSGNTAFGYFALEDNVGGNNNTAVGYDAVKNLSSGNLNTGVGHNALVSLTTGSNNIALGNSAGQNCSIGSYNIHIGNGAVSESNTTRIGDANQTRTFISGIYGVAIAGGSQVVVDSNGQLGNAGISSRLFKRDIADIGDCAELLYDLRPVSFKYNEDLDPVGIRHYGLIAEEVAEVAPDLVFADEDGAPQVVRYEQLVPLLLTEVQELRANQTELLERLDALEAELATFR
jgi:hypothetical protein